MEVLVKIMLGHPWTSVQTCQSLTVYAYNVIEGVHHRLFTLNDERGPADVRKLTRGW